MGALEVQLGYVSRLLVLDEQSHDSRVMLPVLALSALALTAKVPASTFLNEWPMIMVARARARRANRGSVWRSIPGLSSANSRVHPPARERTHA